MLTLACVLIGGGIGAIAGAAAMTTEKGKEINQHMEESWSNHKKDLREIADRSMQGRISGR